MKRFVTKISAAVALLVSAGWWQTKAAVLGQLFDPLNNTNHFIDATLTLTDNLDGTVSLTRVVAGGDLVAHWGKNGTDERILYSDPRFQVEAVASINGGTWGFDIQWFNSGGSYLGQNNIQASTAATSLFTYNLAGLAPVGTASWRAQFRVGAGADPYGFTFTQINAFQVPEPSVLGLGLVGVAAWWRRRHCVVVR